MSRVSYDARMGEAVCEHCGARFGTGQYNQASAHEETCGGSR
jgi:hypothetical protein